MEKYSNEDFNTSFGALENYQALIVRWLTGANYGESGSLYISNRGKGTSLFIKGTSDTRLATLQGKTVRVLTIADTLNIAAIAKRLGLSVAETSASEFKVNGTAKK